MSTSNSGAGAGAPRAMPEPGATPHRRTPGVAARLVLVLLVVVPALVVVTWRGVRGLSSSRSLTNTLFNDIITTQHASAEMVSAIDDVHAAALAALATRESDPA